MVSIITAVFIGFLLQSCNSVALKGQTTAKNPATGSPAPIPGAPALPMPGTPNTPIVGADGNVKEILNFTVNQTGGLNDIVFAIDSSPSMSNEKNMLQNSMSNFIQQFGNASAQKDYKVFVIGEDFRFNSSLPTDRFERLNWGIGSTAALGVFLKFVGQRKLRPGSSVDAVFITDDDSNLRADAFKDKLRELNFAQPLFVHSIVGLRKGFHSFSCIIDKRGDQYLSLSADPAHKGLQLDLCSNNWSGMLSNLGSTIASRPQVSLMKVKHAPNLSRPVEIRLRGALLSPSDARMNADGSITILNQSLLSQSGTMEVTYYKN